DNSLVAYFRDMTGTALLTPQREVQLSRAIEEAEIELWATLLSHPSTANHMIDVASAVLDNSLPEFRTLRAAATRAVRSRTKASQASLLNQGRAVGAKLRALDVDHSVLERLMNEAAAPAGKVPAGTARALSAWRQRIQRAERLALGL